jgi:protein-S-isoprenylcysteine O-methyltransferase Ste14
LLYSKQGFKKFFFKLPSIVQKSYVLLFVVPLFIAPFLKQNKFSKQKVLIMIIGALCTLAGIIIILLSFLKIGLIPSIKKNDGIATNGVYGMVRHPIYFGTWFTQAGLTVMNRSLISLLYLPFSLVLYYAMATIEEKDLIKYFGSKYVEFMKSTKWKIIPYVI